MVDSSEYRRIVHTDIHVLGVPVNAHWSNGTLHLHHWQHHRTTYSEITSPPDVEGVNDPLHYRGRPTKRIGKEDLRFE